VLHGRVAEELHRALADGTEVRLGPLDAVRDFIDARDVAAAVLAAAAAPEVPHPVVNVASGIGVPVSTLVKELVAISGYDGIVHEDAEGSTRSPEKSWQQADITRAGLDLGWRPCHDLVASLAELWEASHDQARV
jgi:NDP-hexose 4-ketoreductase